MTHYMIVCESTMTGQLRLFKDTRGVLVMEDKQYMCELIASLNKYALNPVSCMFSVYSLLTIEE